MTVRGRQSNSILHYQRTKLLCNANPNSSLHQDDPYADDYLIHSRKAASIIGRNKKITNDIVTL